MYSVIKQLYRKFIPNQIHYRIEPFLRIFIYYFFYRGDNVTCPICLSSAKKYITIAFKESEDKICAKCGSLSRSRALCIYIEGNFRNKDLKILDFSPHRSLYDYFKSKFIYYISSDYGNQFYAQKNHDITQIQEENESFDLIICFHVLEHILEDKKAIKELYRVLKVNGILLIQVPLKDGLTYEDSKITSKNARKEAFGQEDHVRVYGKKSLIKKLKDFQFKVETINTSKTLKVIEKNNFGILENEIIFKCVK